MSQLALDPFQNKNKTFVFPAVSSARRWAPRTVRQLTHPTETGVAACLGKVHSAQGSSNSSYIPQNRCSVIFRTASRSAQELLRSWRLRSWISFPWFLCFSALVYSLGGLKTEKSRCTVKGAVQERSFL